MSVSVYHDADTDLGPIRNRTVAVIGYGSQGHAHALNLRDSGVRVIVGLPEGSRSRARAESEGLTVATPAEAARQADLVVILVPDQNQADLYRDEIAPHLEEGNALFFAHGFNVHYGQITQTRIRSLSPCLATQSPKAPRPQ